MDQKLENILNLALETPEEEREQTESLNVGYSCLLYTSPSPRDTR